MGRDILGKCGKRNLPILANLLMLQENTGTNAINLIMGEGHFTEPKMQDHIHDLLREWAFHISISHQMKVKYFPLKHH